MNLIQANYPNEILLNTILVFWFRKIYYFFDGIQWSQKKEKIRMNMFMNDDLALEYKYRKINFCNNIVIINLQRYIIYSFAKPISEFIYWRNKNWFKKNMYEQ